MISDSSSTYFHGARDVSYVAEPGVSVQLQTSNNEGWSVAPGLSTGLRVALIALAFMVVPADGPPRDPLIEHLVQRFAESEPEFRILNGELHNYPGNLHRIGSTLMGAWAAAPGAPMRFYVELASAPSNIQAMRDWERDLASPDTRSVTLNRLATELGHPSDTREDVARFKQAIMNPGLSIQFLNWFDPERRNMTRALQDKRAMFVTGYTHMLGELDMRTGDIEIASMDVVTSAVAEFAALPRKVVGDLWNVHARAEALGPTLHIMSADVFLPIAGYEDSVRRQRKQFVRHFSADHTVVEAQHGQQASAWIVAPGPFASSAREIQEGPDGRRVAVHT